MDAQTHLLHFLQRKKIDVNILKVIDPIHFIVKESASLVMSNEAIDFLQLEEKIDAYYCSVVPCYTSLPGTGVIVVVQPESENKWYRARVNYILSTTSGPNLNVYLLDYGRNCTVKRNRVFEIEKQFLLVPFQAVNFCLLGLKPLSLNLFKDFSVELGQSEEWDKSAEEYVQNICKSGEAFYIEVFDFDMSGNLHGWLHILRELETSCLNDLLVNQYFAVMDEKSLKDGIFSQDLSKLHLQQSQSVGSSIDEMAPKKSLEECAEETKEHKTIIREEFQILRNNLEAKKKLTCGEEKSNGLLNSSAAQKLEKLKALFNEKNKQPLELIKKSLDQSCETLECTEISYQTVPSQYNSPLTAAQISSHLSPSSSSSQSDSIAASQTSIKKQCERKVENVADKATVNQILLKLRTATNKKQLKLTSGNIEKLCRVPECALGSVAPTSLPLCQTIHERPNCSKKSTQPEICLIGKGRLKEPCQEGPTAQETVARGVLVGDIKDQLEDSALLSKTSIASVKRMDALNQHKHTEEIVKNLRLLNKAVFSKSVHSPTAVIKIDDRKNSAQPFQITSSSPKVESLSTFQNQNIVSKGMETVPLLSEKNQNFCDRLKLLASPVQKCQQSPSSELQDNTLTSILKNQNKKMRSSPQIIFEKLQRLRQSSLCESDSLSCKTDIANSSRTECESQIVRSTNLNCSGDLQTNEKRLSTSTTNCDINSSKSELSSIDMASFDSSLSDIDFCDGHVEQEKSKAEELLPKDEIMRQINRSNCISSDFNFTRNDSDPFFKTNLDFSDRSLWDKQGVPALRLGSGVPKAMLRTEEAPFTSKLEKRLQELKFWGPSCIQSVVWPTVFRNRSFVAVAPPHSGKTVAYLLPLLSCIIDRTDYEDLPASNGPILLILCSTWKKVHYVNEQARLLLAGCGKMKILMLCEDGMDSHTKEIALLNGCDILIATPSCMLTYFMLRVTNFERCCHLILDDGNPIIEGHIENVTEVMKMFLSHLRQRKPSSLPMQIAICAEHWTRGISAFVNKFVLNTLLFFTSFWESAVYAHVPVHVHACKESERNSILLSLIGTVKNHKTIIFTIGALAAINIHHTLQTANVYPLLAHESMAHFNLSAVKARWNMPRSGDSPVILVLTDKALKSMNLSDATCLIHYDLPKDSKLQFGNRFSCIADCISNLLNLNETSCVSHILVTEKCQTQAPSLVQILHRVGAEIPPELNDLAYLQQQGITHRRNQLCHYTKAFGFCPRTSCTSRHVINAELDHPRVIPCQGEIKATVNYIFDATHYYVKVLEYLDPTTGDTVSRTAEYAQITIFLQDFFGVHRDNVHVDSLLVGTMYAAKENNGIFHRVKVIDLVPPCDKSDQYEITLLYVDEGWVKNCSMNQLYNLPEELHSLHPFAIEVYLCGVKTPDLCPDWNPQANSFISNLIGGREIHGKIVLCLGDVLWLDPIVIREYGLSFIHKHLNLTKIDKSLMSEGFALNNEQHLTSLYRACEGKIERPRVIENVPDVQNAVLGTSSISYAFLELTSTEEVYVRNIESPHRLFVQRIKFDECLDNLLDDIDAKKENKSLKRCPIFTKGMYCLAPFPEDDRLYRAQVLDVSEENDEATAQLFFVDFGDSGQAKLCEVFALPVEFQLLPFQAIECELAGVSSLHGGWSDRAIDVLFDITRNDSNDMKIFSLKVFKRTPCYSGGYRYVVEIFSEDIDLSQHLVKEGLAVSVAVPVLIQDVPEVSGAISFGADDMLEGYTMSSDDSLLPEEKDAAALMYGVLAGILLKTDNKDCHSSSENEHDEEKSVTANSKPFLSQPPHLLPIPVPAIEGSHPTDLPHLIPLKSSSQSLKAHATWWNSLQEVTVTVQLADVQIYDLQIFDDGFEFSTTLKDMFYSLCETFYAEVVPQETKVNCSGQNVQLLFRKKKYEKWPRLTKSDQKVFYIKHDLAHLETDSGTDNENVSGCKQDEMILPHEEEDSDKEISDEPDSFIPPWEKMCEKRDPYNMFS